MTNDKKKYGVYIHIPFCRQKCFYCDFPSFAGRERFMDEYVSALCTEIVHWGQAVKAGETWGSPATFYIGGGTPSLLDSRQISRLLSAIAEGFGSIDDKEFTVEANPCSLTEEKLRIMKSFGVNRLSIGVQTFDDACLKRIGRLHTASEARNAIKLARQAGICNISADLMYGLPGETLKQLQDDLKEMLSLNPKHISVYGLQLEEGTVLYRQMEMGRLELPSEEETEAMYDLIADSLPAAGYQRYEISNYALQGFESQHNMSYWQDVPYIGLGAGAHSYWQGARYENPADIKGYINRIESENFSWQLEEQLGQKQHMEEFCFLALRTRGGISSSAFRQCFGQEIDDVYANVLQELQSDGLVEVDKEGVRLTSLGMKLGNRVFAEFLLD